MGSGRPLRRKRHLRQRLVEAGGDDLAYGYSKQMNACVLRKEPEQLVVLSDWVVAQEEERRQRCGSASYERDDQVVQNPIRLAHPQAEDRKGARAVKKFPRPVRPVDLALG